MMHTERYVSIAANQRVKREDEASEVARLREAIDAACNALSAPKATNWERVQAAGLILLSARERSRAGATKP